MQLINQLLSFGIEMIDPQKDDFGGRIEKILTELKDKMDAKFYKTRSSIQSSDEVKALEKLIYSRLKMKVQIKLNSMLPAAVIPFFPNPSNVFLHQDLHPEGVAAHQAKMKKLTSTQGFVDTKKAQLGGFFSDMDVLLYMDFYGLFYEMQATVPEVTGFMLHELGHGFYAFEYADRLSSTNQVLASVALALTENDTKSRELMYVELSKLDKNISREEVAKLLSENRVIAGKKIYEIVQKHLDSQLPDGSYDKIAFEQMADNFASRFGYGREIVSGLQKFHKTYGEMSTGLTFIQYFVAGYMSIWVALFALGSSMIFGGIILLLLSFLMGKISGETVRVNTYDHLKVRYKRIRNDMIAQLKDRGLEDEVKRSIIEYVMQIDNIIEKTGIPGTIFDKITNILNSKDRNALSSMQHQQELEDLTSNDIFLKSSQLTV